MKHDWIEADFYSLALMLHEQAEDLVPEPPLVCGLEYSESEDMYSCFLLFEDDRIREVKFNLDFGGGSPFPYNVEQYRVHDPRSILIGGHDKYENFKLYLPEDVS